MSPRSQIPSIAFTEKNLLATGTRWIWLYEVEVPTDPPTRYRFVRDPTPVTFRGNVYSPFPITHSEQSEDDKANLPTINLQVSNATREVIAVLDNYGGLVGQPVRVILTHELAIPTNDRVFEENFRIVSTVANEELITATLGDYDLYATKFPSQRMMRFYCRHVYQDGMCGYSVDSANPFYMAECDKTLYGKKGCQVHGTSEANAGTDILHPERFGGFPGIPEPMTSGGVR